MYPVLFVSNFLGNLDIKRSWSIHDGTLEQVYYILAEEIEIPEPNYNPTPEQIEEAIKGLSTKEDDLIEFETTGMITADRAIELLKDYIQAQEENEEEKCKAYCDRTAALRDRLFAQKMDMMLRQDSILIPSVV